MTVQILRGDCRDVLASLPDESVHCCVTSPPYWGLRSYLPADHPDKHREIGSEPTVEAWVETMVQVFRQVRRVLRNDGTLWLNLGDSYAGSRCGGATHPGASTLNGKQPDHSRVAKHQAFTGVQKDASATAKSMTRSRRRDDHEIPRSDLRMPGYKPKDLIGQPWMLALALRAGFSACTACQLERRSDLWPVWNGHRVCMACLHAGRFGSKVVPTEPGWYLRQELIWAKRSPMPESARDRFTKAHEQVFLLSKREKYYFDWAAIQEPASEGTHLRLSQDVENQIGSFRAHAGEGRDGRPMKAMAGRRVPYGWDTGPGDHDTAEHQTAERHRKVGTGVGFGYGTDAEARERGRVKPPHDSVAARKARAQASNKSHPTAERNGIRPPKADLDTSGNSGAYADGKSERMGRGAGWRKLAEAGDGTKNNDSFDDAMAVMPATRNPRSVRWLSSEPFKGAHFATYPPELIRPFVLAGCPPGGTVLDPFGGSGTTGLVADRLGRNAVLIDLDERNIPMAEQRIEADRWNAKKRTPGLFEEAAA